MSTDDSRRRRRSYGAASPATTRALNRLVGIQGQDLVFVESAGSCSRRHERAKGSQPNNGFPYSATRIYRRPASLE